MVQGVNDVLMTTVMCVNQRFHTFTKPTGFFTSPTQIEGVRVGKKPASGENVKHRIHTPLIAEKQPFHIFW